MIAALDPDPLRTGGEIPGRGLALLAPRDTVVRCADLEYRDVEVAQIDARMRGRDERESVVCGGRVRDDARRNGRAPGMSGQNPAAGRIHGPARLACAAGDLLLGAGRRRQAPGQTHDRHGMSRLRQTARQWTVCARIDHAAGKEDEPDRVARTDGHEPPRAVDPLDAHRRIALERAAWHTVRLEAPDHPRQEEQASRDPDPARDAPEGRKSGCPFHVTFGPAASAPHTQPNERMSYQRRIRRFQS